MQILVRHMLEGTRVPGRGYHRHQASSAVDIQVAEMGKDGVREQVNDNR